MITKLIKSKPIEIRIFCLILVPRRMPNIESNKTLRKKKFKEKKKKLKKKCMKTRLFAQVGEVVKASSGAVSLKKKKKNIYTLWKHHKLELG